MESNKVIKKDANLLAMAKKIFGDIVVEAYVTTYDYGNSTSQEISDRLFSESYKTNLGHMIDIDEKDIILTFTTGNSVLFTNSEWGSISRIDIKKDVKHVKLEE